MRHLIALTVLLCFCASAKAQTCPAASLTFSVVQAAVTSCIAGGTVTLPSGSATWSSSLNITPTGSQITIQGQTTCTGTPASSCTDNTNITIGATSAFIDIEGANATKFVRITGLTINAANCDNNNGAITFNGDERTVAFRDDHNHYVITCAQGPVGVITHTNVYGLHDHLLISTSTARAFAAYADWASAGFHSWQNALALGTNQAIYIEDCTFNLTNQTDGVLDGFAGVRYVFRHNVVNEGGTGFGSNDVIGTHGTDSGSYRSAFSSEVYSNTLTNNTDSSNLIPYHLRGGTGLFFMNTLNGTHSYQGIELQDFRADGSGDTSTWGNCDGTHWELGSIDPTTTNGRTNSTNGGTYWTTAHRDTTTSSVTTAFFDGNPTGTGNSGYACRDNAGRTHDQSLAPVYEWLSSPDPGIGGEAGIIVANQDYYAYTSSFTGATGVGSGTLSARPATCTAGPGGNSLGVGYWATDTQTLYVCNPTNTWTTYYTPYTYPNPLSVPAGCGAFTDQSLCGNVGDAYEGNGPPAGQIAVSACGTLGNGPNYVLTQNIGSDATALCLQTNFPSQALNIDLGGFTITGGVKTATNQPGDVVYHGTINCNITGGVCLVFGRTGRIHHLTIENNNAAPLANINLTSTSASSQKTPIIRVDHVTSTVVAAPNANRTRNIMNDGANASNPLIVSLPGEFDDNLITCLAGASACQGVEVYDAPNTYIHNNYFVMPATCPSCSDSPRAALFDNSSTGDFSFNTILVGPNRGVRVRSGAADHSSLTVTIHDNQFQQIASPGRFAAVHLGENDTTVDNDVVNVYNNSFELAPSGNGVVSAAATNVTVRNNTVTCYLGDCSMVGFFTLTEIPSLTYGSTGTTILVENNNVAPLTSAGIPALMVCGNPGNVLYQCAAGATAGTTQGTICNSGTAVGNGTILSLTSSCVFSIGTPRGLLP